jgi:hypothetical protein
VIERESSSEIAPLAALSHNLAPPFKFLLQAKLNPTPLEVQQQQMRHAYFDGAPGIFISGLVWLAAAVVGFQFGIKQAVGTLLIGGALIHPISIMALKAIGRPAKTNQGNVFNHLAIASTIWLILCCAMAYGLFLLSPALFFPAMLATIGSRYLIFASIFGNTIFWILGLSLIAAAHLTIFLALAPAIAAGMGALIELLFALWVFSKSKPAH